MNPFFPVHDPPHRPFPFFRRAASKPKAEPYSSALRASRLARRARLASQRLPAPTQDSRSWSTARTAAKTAPAIGGHNVLPSSLCKVDTHNPSGTR